MDIWSHASALRTLTRHPVAPPNHFYGTGDPSKRYTPYSLGLAVLGRWLRLSPLQCLAFATVANWCLLCLGVSLVGRRFLGPRSGLLLLGVMVLGWRRAFDYSGSYALPDLPDVLCYPSTFAFAVYLLTLGLADEYLGKRSVPVLVSIMILNTLAALSHPIVGAFSVMTIAVLAVLSPNARPAVSTRLVAALVVSGLVCVAWPYYPVLGLGAGEVSKMAGIGAVEAAPVQIDWLYRVLAGSVLPGLVVPYMFFLALRRPGLRFVAVVWLGAFVLFVVGTPAGVRVARRFGLLIYFPMHLAGAAALCDAWREWRAPGERPNVFAGMYCQGPWSRRLAVLAMTACAVLMIRSTVMSGGFPDLFAAGPAAEHTQVRYARLLAEVKDGDTIMAPLREGWPVTAFSGRIVKSWRDDDLVPGVGERNKAVSEFFSIGTSRVRRREILARWHCTHVLCRVPGHTLELPGYLSGLGTPVERVGDLLLVKID